MNAYAHWDQIYKQADAQAKADAALEADFLSACENGDAGALCMWADMVNDHSRPVSKMGQTCYAKRYQTLSEVIIDAADYKNGVGHQAIVQLLINVYNGMQQHEEAKAILAEMAMTWVNYNSREVTGDE